MSFDVGRFRRAAEAIVLAAESVTEPVSKDNLCDAGTLAAAIDAGLTVAEANELMAECLRASIGDPDADPADIRRMKIPALLAVGKMYGYLTALRERQEKV